MKRKTNRNILNKSCVDIMNQTTLALCVVCPKIKFACYISR